MRERSAAPVRAQAEGSSPSPDVWSSLVAAATRAQARDAVVWLLFVGRPDVQVALDRPAAPQFAMCRRCLASRRPPQLRLRWRSTPPRSVLALIEGAAPSR